jgi:hypothetical protein
MRARMRMLALAAGLVIALGALTSAHPTQAAWTDDEYASATVTSTTLPPPTKGTCTGGVATFTVRWTPVAGPPAATGYSITATNPTTGAVVAGPYAVTPGSANSYVGATLLGTLIAGNYNINLVAVYQNWRSTTITWPISMAVLGLLVTCT